MQSFRPSPPSLHGQLLQLSLPKNRWRFVCHPLELQVSQYGLTSSLDALTEKIKRRGRLSSVPSKRGVAREDQSCGNWVEREKYYLGVKPLVESMVGCSSGLEHLAPKVGKEDDNLSSESTFYIQIKLYPLWNKDHLLYFLAACPKRPAHKKSTVEVTLHVSP